MSPECQASTFPKGDKKNRPAVAVWPGGDIKRGASHAPLYAALSHFCRKLFFAAPVRALPFLSTALGSHASRLHFVRKLVLAAPTSALPFLSTALLSHVPCAIAEPSRANEATTITPKSFVMGHLPGRDNPTTRLEFRWSRRRPPERSALIPERATADPRRARSD